MSKLVDVRTLTTAPVVGAFYRVPHVQSLAIVDGMAGRFWLPTLGSWHEDGEHIDFKHHHYHMDLRFIPPRLFRKLGTRIAGMVLTERGIVSQLRLLRRRCCREMPDHPAHNWRSTRESSHEPWFPKLHAAYVGRSAIRTDKGLVCPHKGFPLSGLPEDALGCVTCPLHALRFSVDTGECRGVAGTPRPTYTLEA